MRVLQSKMPSRRDSDGEAILMLTKDNLSMWVLDIRARLRKKKLWEHTQNPYTPSIVLKDKERYNDEQKAQIKKEKKEWEEKAMEAADEMTPRISLEVKQMLETSHFNNGYLMLSRLYELLQPVGDAQFMRLMKEFYSLKTSDFSNMSEFLTHVKVLMEKIAATNVDFTADKQVLICLMMALEPRYENLTQLWSMIPDLTSERARNMLLEEERRQQNREMSTGMRAISEKDKSKNKKKCPHCGRGIHPEDKCWKLHPEKAPEWYKKMLEDAKKGGDNVAGRESSTAAYSVAF